MERELWPLLYRALRREGSRFSQRHAQYPPWVVAAVTLWAALHDRPMRWACDPANWRTTRLRPWRLPSASTMSRRGHSVSTGLLRRAVEQALRGRGGHPALAALLDGKPLPVSGVSGDKDAGYGRGAGEMSKGYKLHAVNALRPVPEAWEVAPINVAETRVAEGLIPRVAGVCCYVGADANYDAGGLFDLAGGCGLALRTPHAASAGQGHRPLSPHRLRSIEASRTDFGRAVLKARGEVERRFGSLVSFGCGLGPLPPWVRTLRRVRTWVWDKLLINAARIIRRQTA